MGRRLFYGLILLFSYFLFAFQKPSELKATHCTAPKPGSAPKLISAVPHDKSVTLTWTEAQDPVTYYLLAYGTSPNSFEYGAPNVGGRETTSYTVSELKNGVKYYFRVRAVNDCKPGKFSNKITAVPGAPANTVSGVKKTISGGPNLSIYKPVLGASAAASPKPTGKKQEAIIVQTESQKPCGIFCSPWSLLAGEAFLLFFYFYSAHRFASLRSIFSIIIPAVIYLVFLTRYGTCSSQDFSCKYFLPLSALIFMLSVLVQKYKFLKAELIQRPTIVND